MNTGAIDLQAFVEKWRAKHTFNPMIDKRVILKRIARKVEHEAFMMGRMPAPQTIFFAFCGERVYYKYRAKEWVN